MLAALVGVFGLRNHISFLLSAERAMAVVVSVETLDRGEGFPLYRPTVQYLSANGGIQAVAAETYRPTRAGEQLEVAFAPDNPGDARLMDPRDRWILPLWMAVFGVITIVAGITRGRRQARKPA